MMSKKTLFEKIGRETIDRAMTVFYDKIYADPWIGQYFQDIEQKLIESQQGDFLQQLFGGPECYGGRMPIDAHKNMFINEELFDLRHRLLVEALNELDLEDEIKQEWIKLDSSFKRAVVKKSPDQCKPQWRNGPILNYKKPA